MRTPCRSELLEACRLLFGADFDPSFLDHVQEPGLRAAWRLKAFQTHPDRTTGPAAKIRNSDRFIEARRAYGLLQEHLGRRGSHRNPLTAQTFSGAHRPEQRPPQRHRPPRPASHRSGEQRPAAGVPRRRLRLGEFLYHSRLITFAALVEALVVQRRQRERFCEIVRRWSYLSDLQVRDLLARRLPSERVGETAHRLGLLTPVQVRLVLTFQQMRQEPLGKLFVRRGLLSTRGLEEQISRLTRHNAAVTSR